MSQVNRLVWSAFENFQIRALVSLGVAWGHVMMKIILRVASLLVAAAFVAACATQAQVKYEGYTQRWQKANVASMGCFAPILQRPEGDFYKSVFLIDPNEATRLRKLSEERFLTEEEKVLLFRYAEAVVPCRQILLQAASETYAPFVSIVAQYFSDFDGVWISALTDEATISVTNRRILDLVTAFKRDMTNAEQRYIATLSAEHNQEIAQRQAALRAFQQYTAQQQALTEQRMATQAIVTALNRPVTAVCQVIGNNIHCRTR